LAPIILIDAKMKVWESLEENNPGMFFIVVIEIGHCGIFFYRLEIK